VWDAGLGEGRTAVYSNKGSAGDCNELNKEGGGSSINKRGEKNRIIHATNTSPKYYFLLYILLPPLSPSFFVVFSEFSFQLCRDLRPPPLPLAPPHFLTGSDCLKIPDSAEKKCFLAWMAGGRGREEGAGGWRGGVCWDHTAEH